ncbi:MAG: hypothetical protein CXR30_19120 [Geobacter sp.]|nr:MAG: hypothetical protein CXR30_19120 [Geobacter sp.]
MKVDKTIALLLGVNMIISPVLSLAAPVIPGFHGKVALPAAPATDALPELLHPGVIPTGVSGIDTVGTTMTINQNASQAIIDWEKFNIGATASVYFKQKDSTGTAQKDWTALNRIYDSSPSAIFGKLTADGKVYLINQNGILFGAGSQINVHSLVASTLYLREADFLQGVLKFNADNYQDLSYVEGNTADNVKLTPPSQDAYIFNQGSIDTDNGGTVFLLGPNVYNSGSITAPAGKIDLIASAQSGQDSSGATPDVLVLETVASGTNDVVYRTNPDSGLAQNLAGGKMLSDQGRVGMYGNQVQQDGLIRSITAVKKNGEVYLAASSRVTTGAGSVIDVSITDSPEKYDQTFTFSGGNVSVGGVTTSAAPQTLEAIEHNGAILAPSGKVDMRATKWAYLSDTSSIDVAGLWVDKAASDNVIEVQLNSVELKDSYGQKNGFLKGEKIKVDVLTGTPIADISGSYLLQPMSARERATKGGSIFIGAPSMVVPGGSSNINYVLDNIVVKPGAKLDFSGGGFRYAAGTIETSRLLAGSTLYDISSAPEWLTYSKLLTGRKYVDARTVGSDAGKLSLEAAQVLLDGNLKATVTPGRYQAASTAYTTSDNRDYRVSVARGLEEPSGGTLLIGMQGTDGGQNSLYQDLKTREIVVAADPAPLSAAITPGDIISETIGETRTILSAKALNALDLSRLGLYSDTGLTMETGAQLTLLPGASLEAMARVISIQGGITIPGGTVSLSLLDNVTSLPVLQDTNSNNYTNLQYVSLTESITLGNGAFISVAGERIDNSQAAGGEVRSGHTAGGTISIFDDTVGGTAGVASDVDGYDPGGHALIVRSGARLDVSGGYKIDTKAKVSGADAGTLKLRSATMSLAGEMRGYSLAGKNGGKLILHAGEVEVAAASLNFPDQLGPDDPIPDTLKGKLVLGEHRLDNSGFGRIELSAINNVSVGAGITLTPSIAKLAAPTPGKAATADTIVFAPTGGEISSDFTGATALTLKAGANIYTGTDISGISVNPNSIAAISLAADSRLETVPGGSITLSAPAIQVEGALEALSGNISLTATGYDLRVADGATINATGYNKPTTSTIVGVPSGATPQAGGTVSLVSSNGQVILEEGALVDVSGSEPTTNLVKNAAGVPEETIVASTPGTLNITSSTGLVLDGQILGKSAIQGQEGGTLSVRQTGGTALAISEEDIRHYMVSGFDALTFGSTGSLTFQSGMDMRIGRSLTLDTPLIQGNGSDNVTLSAPWIRRINTSVNLPTPQSEEQGTALLSLDSEWLDVTGSTSLAGFGTVRLLANRDLTLSDRYYAKPSTGTAGWYGALQSGGDLVLQGARIYPTTASAFAITSGGSVTINKSAMTDSTPIYSAGGDLTITAAKGINQSGYLAAPMGRISLLSGTGRVYLADGSTTTTAGNAQVNYGSFDGTYWTVKDIDASNKGPLVTTAPENAITLDANEVVVRDGAILDNSGGGSISTYLFQPGIEGSYDPISIDGRSSANSTLRSGAQRFVILADNSVQLPGFTYTDSNGNTKVAGAVHLDATRLDDGTWLEEGTYSLLPESYAFLPGALIISDLGTSIASGLKLHTQEGYQVLAGYDTYAGTSVASPLKGYSVRSAADVLLEGNFTTKELVAGASGDLTIKGTTTVLNGTLKRAAMAGYNQGALNLAAKDIIIQATKVSLPSDLGDNPLTADLGDLTGKMQVSAEVLSGNGGGSVTIGDATVTDSITVKEGSALAVSQVALKAKKEITLEQGTEINAVTQNGDGTVTLAVINADGTVADNGTVTIRANALVHASDQINLTTDKLDLDPSGKLEVDHGGLGLTSKNIVVGPDADTSPGLHLNKALVNSFGNYDNVTLTSTGDSGTGGKLSFLEDAVLTAKKSLIIDAANLVNGNGTAADTLYNVSMTAPDIAFRNSGKAALDPQLTLPGSGGGLTLNADTTTLANDIAINGFRQASFKPYSIKPETPVVNDLTLVGAGTLKTSGDLNMEAARITATYSRDADGVYQAADFSITANGAVNIAGNLDGKAGSTETPGGTLSITGSSITDSGSIVLPSGQVKLTATSGDITLDNADIRAGAFKQTAADDRTEVYSAGGQITLRSDKGAVKLTNGSELDVSAPEQGDAGAIALYAPTLGVDLTGGTLNGTAKAGQGGSFTIDTNNLDKVNADNKLSDLIDKITAGGFNGRLNIRARQGNLDLAADKTIAGHEVVMAADGADDQAASGAIDVHGTIDASNSSGDGGRVELYANGTLTMHGGSSIDAHGTGTGAAGGEVLLNSGSNNNSNSKLVMAKDAAVNVSGGASDKGGSLHLRALRNGNGVNMDLQGAKITGAARVVAEAVRVYDNTTGVITASDQTNYKNDNDSYMSAANIAANRGALLAGLAMDGATELHFRPGMEVRSSGDLALAANWDLTSWRYDNGAGVINEPGVLTLRAGGNLTFGSAIASYNLTDHPTPLASLVSTTMQDSWGYNLAAGASLGAANPLATVRGTGNLLLGPSANGALVTVDSTGKVLSGALVYTENALVRFASGNNTDIGAGVAAKFMINETIRYNLGTYGGAIRGETGNDLSVRGGAIQSAVGDIDLRVGGDLSLLGATDVGATTTSIGTIRTTGEYTPGETVETSPGGSPRSSKITDYWTYGNGGDIDLDVAGTVAGRVNNTTSAGINAGLENAWDAPTGDSLTGDKFLAASYGGTNATEGIATMAGGSIRVRSGGDFTCQTGVFGSGDLRITSGGDLNGRFRLTKGAGDLSAMGNFGTANSGQVLELTDANLTVAAQGDMHIGAVLNPDNCRDQVTVGNKWNLTYSQDAEANFRSLAGSVEYDGASGFNGYVTANALLNNRQKIVTPVFSILAAGDIHIAKDLALAPSAAGNLQLAAGGSIDGTTGGTNNQAALYMVDIDPATVYGRFSRADGDKLQNLLFTDGSSAGYVLHKGDNVPVEITAGQDITNLQLTLNKQATITAGNDIRELKFRGENIGADDITSIRAGHDIFYSYNASQTNAYELTAPGPGLRLGGPGTLLVQAGNNIELGNSAGIQSYGNRLNSALGSKGSTLVVLAGAKSALTDVSATEIVADAYDFFHGVSNDQVVNDYSLLLDRTDKAGTQQLVEIAKSLALSAPDFIEQVTSGKVGLQLAGSAFTILQNLSKNGEIDADTRAKLKDYAKQIIDQVRTGSIQKYFAGKSADSSGSINMVSSQISTLTGQDEIFVLARTNLNVGKSTFVSESTQKSTGISTTAGGPINIYAGGDVNVNESRVMTLLGGHITVWSDQGNINAGRGSKTTVAAPVIAPKYDPADMTKITGYTIDPPSIGSGIRAVTFDPNATPASNLPTPKPGDLYLFAPEGVIDAGEAGIAGNKVILGAPEVLNAKNISSLGSSVGMPTSSEGSLSLGALAGAGSIAENSKMIEQGSAMGSSRDKTAVAQASLVDDFMSKFLDVKVIGFDMDGSVIDKDGDQEKDKK